jgi:hypothetical protein
MICMSVTYSGETWCSIVQRVQIRFVNRYNTFRPRMLQNSYPNQSRLSKENSFSPRNFWDLGIDESQREQNQANDVDVV